MKSVVNGKTIYTVYSASGQLSYKYEPSGDKKTDYLRAAGMTIGRRDRVGAVTYTHRDHLGSAVTTSSASGVIGCRDKYTPYGETMSTPSCSEDNDAFTGHIKDSATGLNYMQARYYDPVIGRFLSVDPVTFMETGNPAHFNRYAYGNNDPVNMLDPDGRQSIPSGGIHKSASQIAYETAVYVYTPIVDFFTEDAIEAGKEIANGNLKAAVVPAVKATVKPVKIISRIKESKKAIKAARQAGKNKDAQSDIDKITDQLSKGNMNPGKGTKSVGGGVSEARGANGGRVMFRETGNNTVEILGKSTKNPKNQQDAINAAKEILKNN